jgi:hypothetical protein
VKIWKYVQYGLFAISLGFLLGSEILLELAAVDSNAARVPDVVHTVRRQYNGVVFYLTSADERRLGVLRAAFWAAFIGAIVIATFRGNFEGRASDD